MSGGHAGWVTVADETAITAFTSRDAEGIRVVVEAWTPAMLRLARVHVDTQAAAEDVVQDSWAVVLRSLDRFEGRSSLRSYVLGVVANTAKRTGARERRTVPFSSAWRTARDDDRAPAVPPERFDGEGGWLNPPTAWASRPEELLSAAEVRNEIVRAIEGLPLRQRAVFNVRDVLGLSAQDVTDLYQVTDGNQRVLLHRARAKIRSEIEAYVTGVASPSVPSGAPPRRPRRGHPVACRQLVELVDDYLDGRLQSDMRSRVEAHLERCQHCGEYVAQVKRVLDVTGALSANVPSEMVDRLLAALRGSPDQSPRA